MPVYLGLDIGTNSVGSAWVDLEKEEIALGVSVFPAGVDETEDKRGAPKNQDRRGKRSLRRSLARRAKRKRRLRQCLLKHGLLPADPQELQQLFNGQQNGELEPISVWDLRKKGLSEKLTPFEFGRVLLHLCQRRGAWGLRLREQEAAQESDDTKEKKGKAKAKQEADEEGKVKAAVEHTRTEMKKRGATTYGEMIAQIAAERRTAVKNPDGSPRRDPDHPERILTFAERPVRNRLDYFEFHADRNLIREEFLLLWEKQKEFGDPLADLLTDDFKLELDNPEGDDAWRHKGFLFGQRRIYWDMGTLGRCDLEPTDRCVPHADRHASYYRVIETVNNIKLRGPGDEDFHPLNEMQRKNVVAKLRTQATGTIAAVRAALGINKAALKKQDLPETAFALNIERDAERTINTDWFHCEIVHNTISEKEWNRWDDARQESLNRLILRFDPQVEEDEAALRAAAKKMGISAETVDRLVLAWQTRPKLEKRLKLSRRAVLNLLPYMEKYDEKNQRWPTQIEARQAFAADLQKSNAANNDPAIEQQRKRYALGKSPMSKADRYFMKKHPDLLPPAPMLANPVVRKAIHEVRRHVIAYLRRFGRKPDRVVIEFARETSKPAKESDRILFLNRKREKIRKRILEETVKPAFPDRFHALSHNQIRAAVDRVVLCHQQRCHCVYCGESISPWVAASGTGLEVDHIIPYSRCGDNSLSNRVLCHRKCNRDKTQKTPREWWGDKFDERCAPLRFMDGFEPDKEDYFTKRDYAAKWRSFSAREVKQDWRKNQLSDTAYAAREVQAYLYQALWPEEEVLLEGDEPKRRVFTTKGRYTALLRKDWQLYETLFAESGATTAEVQRAAAKNRGDHREHALDAVVIALTGPERIGELAEQVKQIDEAKAKAQAQGQERIRIKREPLLPPWGNVKAFRKQVLSLVYNEFQGSDGEINQALVVCHRPVKRKLIGKFHEDTLFGPVQSDSTLFTGRKKVADLSPNHLRMPRPETTEEAIERITKELMEQSKECDKRKAREVAKAAVDHSTYQPKLVDPPPEKSGIVRDIALRRQLREAINRRLIDEGIPRNADTFTKGDIARVLKAGPLRMQPSGVPIHRVVLLRTMNDPVVVPRKSFDFATNREVVDSAPESARAYVGGNNHHIEIREDAKGRWSGIVVPTYEASRRVRLEKRAAVDHSDSATKGGRFIMSLAEGETVYMQPKGASEPDYFVVFKLDKPQTIQFKFHWDARRAKGERDDEGNLLEGSEREPIAIPASKLKELAPPGEKTPIKVQVQPIITSQGKQAKRLEPHAPAETLNEIDARVLAVAREALAQRNNGDTHTPDSSRRRQPGSWSWMKAKLKQQGLSHLSPQLSLAIKRLKEPVHEK